MQTKKKSKVELIEDKESCESDEEAKIDMKVLKVEAVASETKAKELEGPKSVKTNKSVKK